MEKNLLGIQEFIEHLTNNYKLWHEIRLPVK